MVRGLLLLSAMSTAAKLPPSPAVCRPSLTELLGEAQAALKEWQEQPDDAGAWQRLGHRRREVARSVAALPGAQKSGPAFDSVRAFLAELAEAGAYDGAVTAEDLAEAERHLRQGWTVLFAAMLLVPAWRCANAPRLEAVASWMWADYAAYLFYAPKGFTEVGQAAAFAEHYLRRLGELARVVAANRGSLAVRAAATAYVRIGNCIPLYFSTDSLRRHYELRARILAAAIGLGAQEEIPPRPRDGRRLRLGFINRHFGPQTETYTTLPTFEQLDPERFEVLLFAHHLTGAPVETHARNRVAEFHELPADLAAQVERLRAAELDVAVFGTNLTAVSHEVTLLALHRVAPLQVVNNSSCATTGFPEIDLYVSGTLTETPQAPAHFSERLGLLPGPAHAFDYEADSAETTSSWTRADLGLPDDAVVFVSAANYYKIIPEMRHAWARLLASVPGSRLLVHPFNPNWSSDYPIRRFRAEFEQVLAEHRVEAARLVISSERLPSRADVKALLAVGDVYLDTFPFGGVNSLVDPLELAMPVVAWEGATMRSRMGAALLRELHLPELVAPTEGEYLAIARQLAGDAAQRAGLRERIRSRMDAAPLFLDSLAASDLFGGLIESAFDELVAVGREAFRRDRTPLLAPRDIPLDAASRQACAWKLQITGRAERALDYLVAAVTNDPNDAQIWFDLAVALREAGQMPSAVLALESCLRVDPRHRTGWEMLAELARNVGASELAEEAGIMVHELSGARAVAEPPAAVPAAAELVAAGDR